MGIARPHRPARSLALCCLLLLGGCAARNARPQAPTESVEMEALRIVASPSGEGYEFEAYDAHDLFVRAGEELDAGRCEQAVALYDRLLREFEGSVYTSPALYNAGLCLAKVREPERALGYFETLLRTLPDSPDVKHASFQAGHLAVELGRWDDALEYADQLIAMEDLPADERVESLAIRTQALVGRGDLEAAAEQARDGLQYYRIRGFEEIPDPYFAAALAFSLAETIRLRAETVKLPETSQAAQRAALERRAELLLEAQRAYWDTIRHTDAHWSAAAGHRIGQLYDDFWHDIMAVPVPDDLSEGARPYYHQELAKLIRPLLRKAIRNWELTLMMVERTGVDTPWAHETQADLERARQLLIAQPEKGAKASTTVPGPATAATSTDSQTPAEADLAAGAGAPPAGEGGGEAPRPDTSGENASGDGADVP